MAQGNLHGRDESRSRGGRVHWRRLAVLLMAAAMPAGAQQDTVVAPVPAAVSFAKPDWLVARAWCPIGCSEATQSLLKAQVGAVVHLSDHRLQAPFVDACAGSVRFKGQAVAAGAVAAEINRTLAAGVRHLAASDLGLPEAAPVTTAWALCHGAAGETNFVRLPVVAPDRVILLFEEQSLIELR